MGISSRRGLFLAALSLAIGFGRAGASTYTVLHSFPSPPAFPYAALTADDAGYLYGTSQVGGSYGYGTVFRVKTDGTGFEVLHSFSGTASDGAYPGYDASLILESSGKLLGTTEGGGSNNAGTVFEISVDGSGFSILYSIPGLNEGWAPEGGLTADTSGNLFGTSLYFGPTFGFGAVFTLRRDGTGFSILHTFAGGTSDGAKPYCTLAIDSSGNLFGTTSEGGPAGLGTVFKLRSDGTEFTLLHSFGGGAADGSQPGFAGVVFDGSGNLYGSTQYGGTSNAGVLFRIGSDGSGFTVLHSFVGTDGRSPKSGPVIDGSGDLYGVTPGGGVGGMGTVFTLRTDGTGYSILHAFTTPPADGSYPMSSLILDASGELFGTSAYGSYGGSGAVYKVKTDGSGFSLLRAFSSSDGSNPYGAVVRDGAGYLYGTTSLNGPSGEYGTVYKVKEDGTGFSVVHVLEGVGESFAGLVLDGSGYLYGTATIGGYVFKVKTDGTGFSVLYPVYDSYSSLILDHAGVLYGCAREGIGGKGSVFRLNKDGTGFSVLHSFDGSDGGFPCFYGSLMLDDAGYLYGTAWSDGKGGPGTVFKLRTDGSSFSILHFFPDYSPDGYYPTGGLVLDSAGYLYGVTRYGGASPGFGTIFKLKTDGANFSTLHTFTLSSADGWNPVFSLILDASGNLYGTTPNQGPSGNGTIFKIKTDGSNFSLLHSFVGFPSDGARPFSSLSHDGFGNFYGTTTMGGSGGGGTVFKLNISFGENLDLAAPVVVAPTEGQVLGASQVSLKWHSVTGALGYEARIIDGVDSVPVYSGNLSGFSSTATVVNLPGGGFKFGVRACSGGFTDTNCGLFATVDFTVNVLPPTTSTTKFYTLTPCRIVDTRNPDGLYGGPALQAGVSRVFTLAGRCGIPTGAKAVSVNITVVVPTSDGTLKLNPTGADPTVATASSFSAGCIRANNAIAFLGNDGAVSVEDDQATGTTNFIIDVNGYFK